MRKNSQYRLFIWLMIFSGFILTLTLGVISLKIIQEGDRFTQSVLNEHQLFLKNAIRFAHVAVLLLDAEAMPERQDLTIADHVIEEGRALVIAVNKWDLVKDRGAALKKLHERLEDSLPQVRGVPVVTLSALTGAGIDRLLPAVFKAYETWNRRLTTAQLNRWLADILDHHPPPVAKGRRLRLRYITQVKARPPSFVVFASLPDALPESYMRYLVNGLRTTFGLGGVPIRLDARRGKNPYAPDERGKTGGVSGRR